MKHLEIFELYKLDNDVYKNLELLKDYINIVNKRNYDNANNLIILNYFKIIYNFLILEIGFVEYFPYNLNKLLKIKKVNTFNKVYKEFLKLYEPDTKVRNIIEKISDVEIIREYLKDKPNYYNTLIDNVNEELQNIKMFIIKRKYNL